MPHVMVDLETAGNKPGCVILSIGAVAFDPTTKTLGEKFYRVINRESCKRLGMHEDAGTMAWWSRQSAEARKVMQEADSARSTDVSAALDEFAAYVKRQGSDVRVWGCGSDFDNAILAHAYSAAKRSLPWRYYNNRCYRTLKNLAPWITVERSGTHHNALDDAVSQAEHAIRMLTWQTDASAAWRTL